MDDEGECTRNTVRGHMYPRKGLPRKELHTLSKEMLYSRSWRAIAYSCPSADEGESVP